MHKPASFHLCLYCRSKERPRRNKGEKERSLFVERRTMLTIFAAGVTGGHDGVLEEDIYFGAKEELSVKLG